MFDVPYFVYTYIFAFQNECDSIRQYPCILGSISFSLQLDSLLFGELVFMADRLTKSLGDGWLALGFQVCLLAD